MDKSQKKWYCCDIKKFARNMNINKKLIPKQISNWVMSHRILSLLLIVLGFVGLNLFNSEAVVEEVTEQIVPVVEVSAVNALSNTSLFSTVGAVEAVSEAELKSESGGQVTAVYTELGKFVSAGTIIAQLENSRERAAVLQAQGAYEAAEAANASSEVGVAGAKTVLESAKNNSMTSYLSAYNTVSNIVRNDIDVHFSNPDTGLTGLRISGYGQTAVIINARQTLGVTLKNWQSGTVSATAATDYALSLETARAHTGEAISLIDMLVVALSTNNGLTQAEEATRREQISKLSAARGSLLATQDALQQSRTTLLAAKDGLTQAELAAANPNQPSAAGAQMKQALGTLRAAQAAYEKTIVRTPISGVVNALSIKRGDYVSPMQDVALVANNNGLQVTTGINESDRERLAVGDEVQIDNVATGTIIAIGGAVDPKTGKVAVKVSIPSNSSFSNGTNVNLYFGQKATTNTPSELIIPLSAVKLGADGAVVFTVDENSTLVATTVVLGLVRGDKVVIKEGITEATRIVLDARGLKAGETVEVKSN
jgi:RND family efflux transporter MFP subunit